jgi:hypothetical protein
VSAPPPQRLAVLIDAETTPVQCLGGLFDVLAVHGSARVRRAYADWTTPALQPWFSRLRRHGIEPVHHFAARQHRRAMVALALDALDLAQASRLDTVALVGELGAALPLVTRLQATGLGVVGVGPPQTPHDLRAACEAFLNLETLLVSDPTDGGRHRA